MNVLMVDINKIDVMLMQKGFDEVDKNIGFKSLDNGDKACGYIHSTKLKKTSLVLLDLNLPGKTGLEILESLRCESEHIMFPVLMFRTNSLERDTLSALRKGANSYIVKPSGHSEFADLAHAISAYLALTHLAK